MLGVSLAAVRHQLDQCHTCPRTRAVHRFLRHVVDRQHIVAIGLQAVHAVADRLVDKLLRSRLLVRRRRIRIAIVFDDHDQRTSLHSGEVDPFVKGTGAGRAVTDVDKSDPILTAHLERQRDTCHDRDHVAQRGNLSKKSARFTRGPDVAEVYVQLATACR